MNLQIIMVSILASALTPKVLGGTEDKLGNLPDPNNEATTNKIKVARQDKLTKTNKCIRSIILKIGSSGSDVISFPCPPTKTVIQQPDYMIIDGVVYSDKPNEVIDATSSSCIRKTYSPPSPDPTSIAMSDEECEPIKTAINKGISVKAVLEAREKERLEKERIEKERLEKERLEKERLERERLEKERLEKERLEKERLEKERLEKERLEKERLEKERLEKERLEKERLEKERLEKERLEKERLENERLEKERLEKERLEKERLENERLENERLEKERLEKERLENERLEKERLEKERLEKERLEKEKMEQQRQEQQDLVNQTQGKKSRDVDIQNKNKVDKDQQDDSEKNKQHGVLVRWLIRILNYLLSFRKSN